MRLHKTTLLLATLSASIYGGCSTTVVARAFEVDIEQQALSIRAAPTAMIASKNERPSPQLLDAMRSMGHTYIRGEPSASGIFGGFHVLVFMKRPVELVGTPARAASSFLWLAGLDFSSTGGNGDHLILPESLTEVALSALPSTMAPREIVRIKTSSRSPRP
jgi:hypothetical protein